MLIWKFAIWKHLKIVWTLFENNNSKVSIFQMVIWNLLFESHLKIIWSCWKSTFVFFQLIWALFEVYLNLLELFMDSVTLLQMMLLELFQ